MPTCRGCGCTDRRACPGGCSWVSLNPPLCSACLPIPNGQTADLSEDAGAAEISDTAAAPVETFGSTDELGDDFCPADVIGMRRPIWLSEHRGYCIHCRLEFAA